MSSILITGSSDGLGLAAGQLLAQQGHDVVLHARNSSRADDARSALPGAAGVLTGDVSTLAGMRSVAEQANAHGRFDAVIHNVALGYREPRRVETEDGLSQLWAVNVLAPYVLTALINKPDRLVYLSSGMHLMSEPTLDDPQWTARRWNGSQAYAESKFHDVLLAFAVARHWPDVPTNAVNPGWVPTAMGGAGAPDDLDQAHRTQALLAAGEDGIAGRTGRYLYHRRAADLHPATKDTWLQDRLVDLCHEVSSAGLA